MESARTYDAAAAQERWQEFWEADGTFVGVRFTRALGTFTQLAGADKDEAKVEVRIEARLEDGAAATSTDTSPYVYVLMSAVS